MRFWIQAKKKINNVRFYTFFTLTFLRVKVRELFYKKNAGTVNKLVWFGAYGNTNIGDDLIFFSLRQFVPKHIKISLSCRQHSPTTEYGVDTFYRWDKKRIMEEIESGDFVFLGGGGLFESYEKLHKNEVIRNVPNYLYTLLYARLHGKRYAIVGIGCNQHPYPNFILRKVFADVARNAEFIITRDQKSRNGFINNGGFNKNLFANFDPVFSLPPSVDKLTTPLSTQKTQRTIGFLIWPFHLYPAFIRMNDMNEIVKHTSKDNLDNFHIFCSELKKTFQQLKDRNIKSIFPLFHVSDKILLDELGCTYENQITFDSYFSQLKQCDIVVSMRYHVQITSILNNIPVISIPVQEKMTALVENFNLEEFSIDLETFTADQCVRIVDNIFENESSVKEKLSETLKKISGEVKDVYSKTIASSLS
jgi:polysaccharide pyruvyl transferase WcaK-like protein